MCAYGTSLLLQATICEIKIAKLLGAGRLQNIHPVKICTHTIYQMLEIQIFTKYSQGFIHYIMHSDIVSMATHAI